MRGSALAWLYRTLVRLYPRSFRDEYGDDLVALFQEQCRDENPLRVSLRAAVDLMVTVPTRHLEQPMGRRAANTSVLLYLALALGGVVAALLSGTNAVGGSIALLVAVAAAALALTSWRRSADTTTDATAIWWKLIVAGGSLIASTAIGARLGIAAWHLGMAVFLGGVTLGVAGVLLGASRLLRRRSPVAG